MTTPSRRALQRTGRRCLRVRAPTRCRARRCARAQAKGRSAARLPQTWACCLHRLMCNEAVLPPPLPSRTVRARAGRHRAHSVRCEMSCIRPPSPAGRAGGPLLSYDWNAASDGGGVFDSGGAGGGAAFYAHDATPYGAQLTVCDVQLVGSAPSSRRGPAAAVPASMQLRATSPRARGAGSRSRSTRAPGAASPRQRRRRRRRRCITTRCSSSSRRSTRRSTVWWALRRCRTTRTRKPPRSPR